MKFFGCVCFIVNEIRIFLLGMHFSRVHAFESLRPLGISLSWFACVCIVVSGITRHHCICNTFFASVGSGLLHSIDWGFFLNRGFRVQKKISLGSHYGGFLNTLRLVCRQQPDHLAPLGPSLALFYLIRVLLFVIDRILPRQECSISVLRTAAFPTVLYL